MFILSEHYYKNILILVIKIIDIEKFYSKYEYTYIQSLKIKGMDIGMQVFFYTSAIKNKVNLTVGRIYKIIESKEDNLIIKNDVGKNACYKKIHFYKVPDNFYELLDTQTKRKINLHKLEI